MLFYIDLVQKEIKSKKKREAQEPLPNRHGELWSLAVIACDISGISVYLHSAAANPPASALMSQIRRDLATGDILTALTLMDGGKEGRWRIGREVGVGRARDLNAGGRGGREGKGRGRPGLVSQVAMKVFVGK